MNWYFPYILICHSGYSQERAQYVGTDKIKAPPPSPVPSEKYANMMFAPNQNKSTPLAFFEKTQGSLLDSKVVLVCSCVCNKQYSPRSRIPTLHTFYLTLLNPHGLGGRGVVAFSNLPPHLSLAVIYHPLPSSPPPTIIFLKPTF